MKKVTESLPIPLGIDAIQDGYVYIAPHTQFSQTGLFLEVTRIGNVFIKIPSKRGWNDYHKYVKLAEPDPDDIRSLEPAERFENLEKTLKNFPVLESLFEFNKDILHWLIIYRLQYERCRSWINIPVTKFCVLHFKRFGIFSSFKPAIFQERVDGVRLWDMIDISTEKLSDTWKHRLPSISRQLSPLLMNGKIEHINWNIQNFIFNEKQNKLYYVDLTPTLFVAKWGNEHNLKGIREEFSTDSY